MFGIGLQEVILLLPLVAIYLLASVTLVPYVASSKGGSGLAWMFVALLMSPLLALIALVAVPPGEAREPINPFDAEPRR
ncbi:MAG: hypothetical protein DME16_26095 [Candidatus Rokuibacteriota bacterium]|nr:MAG: hypothetical protein DME16_26095 [Candidatus Rokubacteria bacterium]